MMEMMGAAPPTRVVRGPTGRLVEVEVPQQPLIPESFPASTLYSNPYQQVPGQVPQQFQQHIPTQIPSHIPGYVPSHIPQAVPSYSGNIYQQQHPSHVIHQQTTQIDREEQLRRE